MPAPYVPARGDLVWLQFSPQVGHEQAGRRPALVISPASYNRRVGLAVCCPVTSQVKGYPFEVLLPAGLGVEGAVLSDQIKSLDWRARKARRIAGVPADVLHEAAGKILSSDPPGHRADAGRGDGRQVSGAAAAKRTMASGVGRKSRRLGSEAARREAPRAG